MAKNNALKSALAAAGKGQLTEPATTAATTTTEQPAQPTAPQAPAPLTITEKQAQAIFSTIVDTQIVKQKAEQLKKVSDQEKGKLQQEIEKLQAQIDKAKTSIKSHDQSIKDAIKDITGTDTTLTDLVKQHARDPKTGTCKVSVLQDIFKAHSLWPITDGKPTGINTLCKSTKPTEQALGKAFQSLNTLCSRVNEQEIAAGKKITNDPTNTTAGKAPTPPQPAPEPQTIGKAAQQPTGSTGSTTGTPTTTDPKTGSTGENKQPAQQPAPAPAKGKTGNGTPFELWQEIAKQISTELTDPDLAKLIGEICKDAKKRIVVQSALNQAIMAGKQGQAK